MEPSFSSIFHAFNIPYSTIKTLAPHLSALGFTHIQFPPIQTSRVLNELDVELLHSILKTRDTQLRAFHELCMRAHAKNAAYPTHSFDYLLRQRTHYIRQPTIRQLHALLLEPTTSFDTLHERLLQSMPASLHLLSTAYQVGAQHPFYPLIEAATLVLSWKPVHPTSSPESDTIAASYARTRQEIAACLRTGGPVPAHLLQQCSALKKARLRNASWQRQHDNQTQLFEKLRALVSHTTALRARFLSELSDPHLLLLRSPASINIPTTREWLDVMTVCEYFLYPPWWMVYQPIDLGIGPTLLGTTDDIHEAIHVCKANGLSVIADVVVNNLAAVGGEKQSWASYTSLALSRRAITLSDVVADDDTSPPFVAIRSLLQSVFQSTDMTLLTAPYDCTAKQDPTRCWMSGCLPQLNQNHPSVIDAQTRYMRSLKDAGVDGIRIDAAVHIPAHHCARMMDMFDPSLSYIEYVGDYNSAYDAIRKEDFSIGDDIYGTVFSEQAQFRKTKNFGGNRLRRLESLDSVVMIINHDHLMGSIPSNVFAHLPSQHTYELSLAYILQRIYGNVLLLPHDIEFAYVIDALELRRFMKQHHIVREYVSISNNSIEITKFNTDDIPCAVAVFNMNPTVLSTRYGLLEPLSFQWYVL